MFSIDGYQVYRHVCPRNCFCSCGILSYVRHGRLEKVAGDPRHGFNQGRLCAKGYAYVQRVYSPERVVFPLRQVPRGSGNWERISWDEALDIIARKILEIKGRYNSLLPLALYAHYGNIGLLHLAVEGFFDALGYISKINGNLCWSAGLEANLLDMGTNYQPDPETMAAARTIVVWGANPAWTALHQMHIIEAARRQGALIVVIDPVLTSTAARADVHIRIKPGGDGALALGVAKYLIEQDWCDEEFIANRVAGWDEFLTYLRQEIDYKKVCRLAGVTREQIGLLAELLSQRRPAVIWKGMGLQRYSNGGQNVRAINALAAITGNLSQYGGGLYYASLQNWDLFNYHARNWSPPSNIQGIPAPGGGFTHRFLKINRTGRELLAAADPPVRFLWLARSNPFSQGTDLALMEKAIKDMEMVVLVDQFLTPTAAIADIFLPCTTQFEEWDIVISYWHSWVAINQPAIDPVGESRSDLRIAWALSHRLNDLSPGCCRFPAGGEEEEWVAAEFNPRVYKLLGIRDYRELLAGPRKLQILPPPWQNGPFPTPSGKYELYSAQAGDLGLPALPEFKPPLSPPPAYPYRLLTPHMQASNNSQFYNLPWLAAGSQEPVLRLHPKVAARVGLKDGGKVRVYNSQGEIILPARITATVPPDIVVCYQGGMGKAVNRLLGNASTDMGAWATGAPSPAFFDTFVNIVPL